MTAPSPDLKTYTDMDATKIQEKKLWKEKDKTRDVEKRGAVTKAGDRFYLVEFAWDSKMPRQLPAEKFQISRHQF